MRKGVACVVGLGILALGAGAAEAQSWRDVTESRQITDERSLDVRVTYGAGTFNARRGERGVLYRMQLRYDEDTFTPVAVLDGDELRLGTESVGRHVRIGRGDRGGNLDLFLSDEVPMNLTMDFGAVSADLDLGGLRLTELEIATGASRTVLNISEPNRERMRHASLDIGAAEFTALGLGNLNTSSLEVDAGVGDITLEFSGDLQRDMEVSIDMGLGSLELRIPEGVGVRLKKDTFLVSIDTEGLVKRGDAFFSPDYETADVRINLNIDAAFGSIKVVWLR